MIKIQADFSGAEFSAQKQSGECRKKSHGNLDETTQLLLAAALVYILKCVLTILTFLIGDNLLHSKICSHFPFAKIRSRNVYCICRACVLLSAVGLLFLIVLLFA